MKWLARPRRSASSVEDSVPLRLAVLATTLWGYLTIGIVAGLLPVTVVAAVLTIVGHWSIWRSRRHPSSARTWILAGALGAVVLWVLGDLAVGFAGARLPQAQLGMLVQAITSFDLRTRRSLYATLLHTIGIFYLASNFGFSLLFGAFLLVLACCLAAVLTIAELEDKRRRSQPFRLRSAAGGWVYWSGFAVASMLLTLIFTILMPRTGGTQLLAPLTLTLPFSAPTQPELVEPLVPFLELGAGGGSGGAADARVDLSYRGRFNQAVAFYVRSPQRSYWRGLVFDRYTGSDWTSTSREYPLTRDRRGRYELPTGRFAGEDERSYVQTFY
ncbi:MAG TPA: transglutaminaseTgpA domain-containing protein, partial [Chloroflexota bacterium]|nr:transglutaminaseTgpA domain-containing protein [Chloroflexota bacterium]